ncbi:hypothetical protein CXT76_01735 [Candidatus Parvarchaeota archaeon]|jgi:hypothetical protein|nr:MAG: hypothetical protein CXT76_01735 [Candidatus Parvarchaeota archaeon]HIG51994.1 hypothetical protein [Candidatus Pacearchaeota archaeon]
MKDIFDATILCNSCKMEMKPILINKSGFGLRAVECQKCKDKIIHPSDINNFEKFNNLKRKEYSVKLRMVGNSHAISIPKEIVNFIKQQEREMDTMVRLCLEDMERLSLRFGGFDAGK